MSRYLPAPTRDMADTVLSKFVDHLVDGIRECSKHTDPLIVSRHNESGVDADNNRYDDPERVPLYLSQLLDEVAILKEKIKEVPEEEFNHMSEYTNDGSFTLPGQVKHIYLLLSETRAFWTRRKLEINDIPPADLYGLDTLLYIMCNYKDATQEDKDAVLQAGENLRSGVIESNSIAQNIFEKMYQKYEIDDDLWDDACDECDMFSAGDDYCYLYFKPKQSND